MTQQKKTEAINWLQVGISSVVLAMAGWTLATVNSLQKTAVEHTVKIDNIEKSIVDIKEISKTPTAKALANEKSSN